MSSKLKSRNMATPHSMYLASDLREEAGDEHGSFTLLSLLLLPARWVSALHSLLLLVASFACASLATVGCLLLGYLLLTRALTPERHTHVRHLHLDFASGDMLAEAVFLPPKLATDESLLASLPPDSRFLPAGETIDVSLELCVPGAHFEGGMVQAVAELRAADGRIGARTSSAVRLHGRTRSLWSFLTAPYRWVGLLSDEHVIRVPLFTKYKEKASTPFIHFRAALKSPHAKWVPEILSAEARVHVRLGMIRGALYCLRPHFLLGLLLAAGALTAMVGGSVASLVFLALWIQACSPGAGARAKASAAASLSDDSELLMRQGGSELGSDADSEVLTAGPSTPDDAALLHDPDEPPPSLPPRPVDHDWHEVLSDPGSSVSQAAAAGGEAEDDAPGPWAGFFRPESEGFPTGPPAAGLDQLRKRFK